MIIPVCTLNVFDKSGSGGNPAGVVTEAESLTEKQMQKIAAKVGFSETAFIQRSDTADFRVRFFTPAAEVDLCGHATVGTFFLLSHTKTIGAGIYTQETKAGILQVEIKPDGLVMMDQNTPVFYGELDRREIAASLNTGEEAMGELPVWAVSTGLKDIIVHIRSLEELLAIEPDFNKVAEISRKNGAAGYHLFTLETMFGATAHCRNLAPLYGIYEEAATGTATGALSSYLFMHNKLRRGTDRLVFEQGYSMSRPSEIMAGLEIREGKITGVKVGGIATNIKKIAIEI